jgi:hypothetical protein
MRNVCRCGERLVISSLIEILEVFRRVFVVRGCCWSCFRDAESRSLQIACGQSWTCCVTTANQTFCWGWYQNLGLDVTTNEGASAGQMAVLAPVDVGAVPVALSVSLWEEHSCAMMEGPDRIQCWGLGVDGQLGRGNAESVGCGGSCASEYGGIEVKMRGTVPVAV